MAFFHQIYMSRAVMNHMFWDCPLVNGDGVADLGNFNEFLPMSISYDGPRCSNIGIFLESCYLTSKLPRMHFDVWALHLETMSPELQYEEERFPSWVAHMGWVSELQVREFHS